MERHCLKNKQKWKMREIRHLISSVKTLKLIFPAATDDEWLNIDKFLKKPCKYLVKPYALPYAVMPEFLVRF